MSQSTGGDENESDEPLVPEEVLERIQDLKDGETARKDDLESVLKFWVESRPVSRVPFSDEETRVIFGKGTLSDLAECDGQTQEQLLKRLVTICENVSPPDYFIYETIKNLDIIRAGDTWRLYTKVVTHIPEGNTEYHVIFVLYIDADHDYDQSDLTTFSKQAQADLNEITDLETVPDVEAYLDDHDAMDESDLRDLLDR